MICPICTKPLNEAQWKNGYKSCPACSQNEGVHIFYKYPDTFGTTPLRASQKHPDGPQSYCELCRGGNKGAYLGALRCNEI